MATQPPTAVQQPSLPCLWLEASALHYCSPHTHRHTALRCCTFGPALTYYLYIQHDIQYLIVWSALLVDVLTASATRSKRYNLILHYNDVTRRIISLVGLLITNECVSHKRAFVSRSTKNPAASKRDRQGGVRGASSLVQTVACERASQPKVTNHPRASSRARAKAVVPRCPGVCGRKLCNEAWVNGPRDCSKKTLLSGEKGQRNFYFAFGFFAGR